MTVPCFYLQQFILPTNSTNVSTVIQMTSMIMNQEYSNNHNGNEPDCMQMWYSNHVTIPGDNSRE